MGGGHRFVVLDECHQLTKDAQGALLKVLEDIPPYQSYALCTTDPAKILETIKTRCEKVVVARLSRDELMETLLLACAKGGLKDPTESVLASIVRAADGCPREALVTLEKVDGLKEADALKLIVATGGETGEVLDICRALGKKPWKAITALLSRVEEDETQNVEPEGIRLAVLGYLASCLAGSESNEDAARFTAMIEPLCEPVYASGRAGLLAGLFRAQEASMNMVKK
jgi:DNA polymerase-3 subunit gamma/tau